MLELVACGLGQLAPGGVPRDNLRPCDLARLVHRQREPVLGEVLRLVHQLPVAGRNLLDHVLLNSERITDGLIELLSHLGHNRLIDNVLSGVLLIGSWRGRCDGELLVKSEDITVIVCAGDLADVLRSCLLLSGLIRVSDGLGEGVRQLSKRARIVCPTALDWSEVVTFLAIAVGQVKPEVVVEIGLSAASCHLIVYQVSLQIDPRLFVLFGALHSRHIYCRIILSGHNNFVPS